MNEEQEQAECGEFAEWHAKNNGASLRKAWLARASLALEREAELTKRIEVMAKAHRLTCEALDKANAEKARLAGELEKARTECLEWAYGCGKAIGTLEKSKRESYRAGREDALRTSKCGGERRRELAGFMCAIIASPGHMVDDAQALKWAQNAQSALDAALAPAPAEKEGVCVWAKQPTGYYTSRPSCGGCFPSRQDTCPKCGRRVKVEGESK